jgi:isopentenyl-diphosphate Delta-isomerase
MKNIEHIELIDVLDSEGRPTGQRKTKNEVLDNEDWRDTVHIWIVNSLKQVLTQQRTNKGLWDNLWDVSVGGGVAAGEEHKHAAARELKEELGLQVEESRLTKLGVWKMIKTIPERPQEAREFSHTYLLPKEVDINDLTLRAEEVAQVDWKSLSNMRAEIEDDKLYENWVPHPRSYYLEVMELIEKSDG